MFGKIGLLALACLSYGVYSATFGNLAYSKKSRHADNYYSDATAPELHRRECNNLYNKGSSRISCTSLNNPESEKTDVFLWGDSFASAMVPGLTEMAELHKFNFEYSILAGCAAVLGMQRTDTNINCAKAHERTAKHLDETSPPIVLLTSSYAHNVGEGLLRPTSVERVVDNSNFTNEFALTIKHTIDRLRANGATVLILTEPPRHRVDPVIDKMKSIMVGRGTLVKPTTLAEHKARVDVIYSIFDQSGIDLRLDYSDFFCGTGQCITEADGRSLYKDRSHISNYASVILAKKLVADMQSHGYLNQANIYKRVISSTD